MRAFVTLWEICCVAARVGWAFVFMFWRFPDLQVGDVWCSVVVLVCLSVRWIRFNSHDFVIDTLRFENPSATQQTSGMPAYWPHSPAPMPLQNYAPHVGRAYNYTATPASSLGRGVATAAFGAPPTEELAASTSDATVRSGDGGCLPRSPTADGTE